MDQPLMGTPRANYTFFYTAGGSVILSLILLLIITTYSAITIGDLNVLMKEIHQIIDAMNELLPDARFGAEMLGLLCKEENFTKWYPNTRELCGQQPIAPNYY
tara:strand:+ start:225 stop:533 length:309 start_codon:yes stop_codon:yes gene_type:complete